MNFFFNFFANFFINNYSFQFFNSSHTFLLSSCAEKVASIMPASWNQKKNAILIFYRIVILCYLVLCVTQRQQCGRREGGKREWQKTTENERESIFSNLLANPQHVRFSFCDNKRELFFILMFLLFVPPWKGMVPFMRWFFVTILKYTAKNRCLIPFCLFFSFFFCCLFFIFEMRENEISTQYYH